MMKPWWTAGPVTGASPSAVQRMSTSTMVVSVTGNAPMLCRTGCGPVPVPRRAPSDTRKPEMLGLAVQSSRSACRSNSHAFTIRSPAVSMIRKASISHSAYAGGSKRILMASRSAAHSGVNRICWKSCPGGTLKSMRLGTPKPWYGPEVSFAQKNVACLVPGRWER